MPSNGLSRFHTAQADAHHGYATALEEIRTTGKRSHWIWYVFPQLAGLGRSPEARRFGIAGRTEAAEYLGDPLLRARLLEITTAVAEQLDRGWSLESLLGSTIDALKLVSSLTLFEQVNRHTQTTSAAAEGAALSMVIASVLAAAEAQGYTRCALTNRQLAD